MYPSIAVSGEKPELTFQAFQSSDGQASTPSADRVWIHPRGDAAVMIGGIAGTGMAVRAAESCIEILNTYPELVINDAGGLLLDLHDYLQRDHLQAVVGIVRWRDHDFELLWSGNIQLYGIDTLKQRVSTLISVETLPVHALGRVGSPRFQTAVFEMKPDSLYLLATGGIDFHTLRAKVNIGSANLPNLQWGKLASAAARESDWTLLTFSVEMRFSFVHSSWPYNPFIGPFENTELEKRGLARIASALFNEPDFLGFFVVGGYRFFKENVMHRFDGVLVSPWGVVLLDLKDHCGTFTLNLTDRNNELIKVIGGHESMETNPVKKLNEGLAAFKQCNLGISVDTPLRNIAAVVFTHPLAQVTYFHTNNQRTTPPTHQGNILIASPEALANQLRQFVQSMIGKNTGALLSEKKCLKIAQSLTSQARPSPSAYPSHQAVGRYTLIEEQSDPAESTRYYRMYKGHDSHLNRTVWLKRFPLSRLTHGEHDHEEDRIGRKMIALQELDAEGVDGVQKFYEKIRHGSNLYFVLEYIDGPRLEAWLRQRPSREHRLTLLRQIVAVLEALEPRNIVHRALSPANIRVIPKTNQPILTNFELCLLNDAETLPVVGHGIFNSPYQAQEIHQPGGIVTPSADIYSFGNIACLVLAGELPFQNYHDQVCVAHQPGFWETLRRQCGLNSAGADVLRKTLDPNPTRRPKAAELREFIATWQ